MTAQAIDKNLLKTVLEEMLAERNPALRSVLEELLVKILSAQRRSDRTVPSDEAAQLALPEELLAIVEERLAAYEAAPDNTITWEQVRASSADEQRFVARKLLVKSMSVVDAATEVPEELITESIEAIRSKRYEKRQNQGSL